MPRGVFKREEWLRKKISNTMMGRAKPWLKGRVFPHMHRKITDEAREKNRLAHIGKPAWNKGKKLSEDYKLKLSKAKTGEKSRFWMGGIRKTPYTFHFNKTLKRIIRKRDGFSCSICNKLQGKRLLSIHHIDYDKKNCSDENLISLCISCHAKTNINRDCWEKYFKEKIKIIYSICKDEFMDKIK